MNKTANVAAHAVVNAALAVVQGNYISFADKIELNPANEEEQVIL
ncbi:hypothetical protein ACNEJB_003728 [Escherichia coli]